MAVKRGKYKQSTEGIVRLVNKDGGVIVIRKYGSIAKRDKYIKTWKYHYGQQFKKLIIVISPELDEELLLSQLEAEDVMLNEIQYQ